MGKCINEANVPDTFAVDYGMPFTRRRPDGAGRYLSQEIYALDGTKLRKLTSHNDALLSQRTLVPAEDISAKSKDGTDVHGLLTMPLGYQPGTKAPMLLFIHGGPTAQDDHRFAVERQMFAAHGYAVLNVNYRGSNGRGHAYSETISDDWGNKEVADLLAVVDGRVDAGDGATAVGAIEAGSRFVFFFVRLHQACAGA